MWVTPCLLSLWGELLVGPVLEDEFYGYPFLFLPLSLFHMREMADVHAQTLAGNLSVPGFLQAPITILFALATRYCDSLQWTLTNASPNTSKESFPAPAIDSTNFDEFIP